VRWQGGARPLNPTGSFWKKINIEKISKNQILRPKIEMIFKLGVICVSV
jgi:hypothetical protein